MKVRFQVFKETGKPFQFNEKKFSIELGPGEVLIRISLATICGSDVHTFDGKRKEDAPCILGHEGIGEIIEVNSRDGFKIGDRVTWTIIDNCGECSSCTDYELPEKCEELFKYGHASIHKGTGLNGCYSTHIHIRKGTHLVKVPQIISDVAAVPANCALATMVNAISQIKCIPEKVIIQGGGLLGVYTCALLKEIGVPEIYCLEVDENRFELIEKFGGVPVNAQNLQKTNELILNHAGGHVDVVLEVAGIKELIPQGLSLLRPGGEYILVGLVHPDSELGITAEQIIRKCISIKGVHNYSPRHLDEAISFLERNINQFPFEELVSPPYKLEGLNEAIIASKTKKWMRISVKP